MKIEKRLTVHLHCHSFEMNVWEEMKIDIYRCLWNGIWRGFCWNGLKRIAFIDARYSLTSFNKHLTYLIPYWEILNKRGEVFANVQWSEDIRLVKHFCLKKKTKLQPTFPFPICILLFSLRSLDVADPKPASSLRLRSMSAFCFCWYRIWKMCFVCEKWKVLLDDQKMVVSNNYTNDGKNVTIMLSNYLWFVGKKMFHLLIIDMKWDWSCWTRDKVSSYYTNEVMWQQLGKCKCWTSNWIKLIVVLE